MASCAIILYLLSSPLLAPYAHLHIRIWPHDPHQIPVVWQGGFRPQSGPKLVRSGKVNSGCGKSCGVDEMEWQRQIWNCGQSKARQRDQNREIGSSWVRSREAADIFTHPDNHGLPFLHKSQDVLRNKCYEVTFFSCTAFCRSHAPLNITFPNIQLHMG